MHRRHRKASGHVYLIRNLVTKRFYIGGTTVTPNKRFSHHLSVLRGRYHSCKLMQEDFNEFGADSFVLEWWEFVPDVARSELSLTNSLLPSGRCYNSRARYSRFPKRVRKRRSVYWSGR